MLHLRALTASDRASTMRAMAHDLTKELQERVHAAGAASQPLEIVAGGSKRFYGRTPSGEVLDISAHRGIVHYAPEELVLTARAATPLSVIQRALADHGQMLAFEPPLFDNGPDSEEGRATLGGTIACGFSGPRRPYAGSARDFVLGVKIINGSAEVLRFGGEVMKNVAGYDVSRLMVGALGTLGLLLEVSLKVMPRPVCELTLRRECEAAHAIVEMNRIAAQPLPVSAAVYDGAAMYVRLSGTDAGVRAAQTKIGGDEVPVGEKFWADVREQRHPFFSGEAPLWRLSLAPATPPLALGASFIDWGGAQRWTRSEAPAEDIRSVAAAQGGYATLFRGGNRGGAVFQPLTPALAELHRRLKTAFDAANLFNRGRLYSGL